MAEVPRGTNVVVSSYKGPILCRQCRKNCVYSAKDFINELTNTLSVSNVCYSPPASQFVLFLVHVVDENNIHFTSRTVIRCCINTVSSTQFFIVSRLRSYLEMYYHLFHNAVFMPFVQCYFDF
jgi:hypothetical protein